MVWRRWAGRRSAFNLRHHNKGRNYKEIGLEVRLARQDGGSDVARCEHDRRGLRVVIATRQLAAIATVTLKLGIGRCGGRFGIGNNRTGRASLTSRKDVGRLTKVKLRREQQDCQQERTMPSQSQSQQVEPEH